MLLLTPKGHLAGHTGDMTASVPVTVTVEVTFTVMRTVKSVSKYLEMIEYGEMVNDRERKKNKRSEDVQIISLLFKHYFFTSVV